jgi:hypothetical protein
MVAAAPTALASESYRHKNEEMLNSVTKKENAKK